MDDLLFNTKGMMKFSIAILKANTKSWKTMVVSLGFPAFMLLSFWLPSIGGRAEDIEFLHHMFPALIMLAVMIPGQGHAARLTSWKQHGTFKRLMLTPIPLSYFVIGASISQVVMGMLQGIVMILTGFFIIDLIVSFETALLIMIVFVLASSAFTAFGSMIAGVVEKAEVASYVFFVLFIPLFFLGSFPDEMLPVIIQRILPFLPTKMAIDLIDSLIATGTFGQASMLNLFGLVLYTIGFGLIGAVKFNRE